MISLGISAALLLRWMTVDDPIALIAAGLFAIAANISIYCRRSNNG